MINQLGKAGDIESMSTPREPTVREKMQLVKAVLAQQNRTNVRYAWDEVEDAFHGVEAASIAVFDDYVTEGPGYAGKVLVVVWSPSPSFFDVFIENERDKLVHQVHALCSDHCGQARPA